MTLPTLTSVALHNVSVRFDAWGRSVHALREVSLELPVHGLVLVLGENASGKSTLLRTIEGVLQPTSGRVEVLGRDPARCSARWRANSIASVGQHPERDLVPEMTVEEHSTLFGYSWDCFEAQLWHLEPEGHFSLLHFCRKRRVGILSGGQRQTLGLALQLLRPTPIVMLDEPFAALDEGRLAAFTGMIRRVAEKRCVLNVTHAPDQLRPHAAKVIRLQDGALVEDFPRGERNGSNARG